MCGAGHFVHRVTFCAEGNESGSFSAQSVTLCTKCSPRRPHWFAGRAVSGLVSRGGLLWRGQGKGPGCGGGVGGGPSGSASLSGCLLVVSSCRGRGAGCLLPGSGGVQVVWGRGWSPVGGCGAWWWRGVVLHIHPGVLVGSVAWFQRFLALGGVRGQDECATRAPLHIHPVSGPWFARQIRVVPPFTDRGL